MADIYNAGGYYGQVNEIQQNYADTCAIKSQQIILNDFGVECTEDDLVQFSYEQGWYTGNGTSLPDVGNLLETAGIPVTRMANANVFNLVNELAQGHKVIVGVDADELWDNDSLFGKLKSWLVDFFGGEEADHALIVAGIDTSDPNNTRVIVTDPGNGDYRKSYPLDVFMDAWSDSSCYMVSTDISVPQTVPGMENFEPEVGHIEDVAGVPYTDFQIFNDMSYGLPAYTPMGLDYFSPINSFTNTYFDFANHNIGYMDVFNGDFMNYMSPDLVMPQLYDTYHAGLPQIDFSPLNDWNHYAMENSIPMMTNLDYSNFLNQSLLDFQAMNDMQSVMYCQQQMMMLDFCDNFGMDFYNNFYL